MAFSFDPKICVFLTIFWYFNCAVEIVSLSSIWIVLQWSKRKTWYLDWQAYCYNSVETSARYSSGGLTLQSCSAEKSSLCTFLVLECLEKETGYLCWEIYRYHSVGPSVGYSPVVLIMCCGNLLFVQFWYYLEDRIDT